MNFKGSIVFDMDDTLYKEESYRESGLRAVAMNFAASCGLKPEELYKIMQIDPRNTFERVTELASQNNVEVTVTDQLTVYRSHRPQIELSEDVKNMLVQLRLRGYQLGVITDGRAWGQLNKLAALKLADFIEKENIIVTSQFNTDKHHREPFEMMMSRLKNNGMFTYVGDNPEKDFKWPNLMGWRTIMLRDSDKINIHRQKLNELPPENKAQITIDNINVLLDIFR